MTHKTLKHLAAIAIVCAAASSVTSAVGNGLPFVVHEVVVPGANAHDLNSNSLDFTYHSCVDFTGQNFQESGYFWVSSYQNPTSVVDSQINYYQANGYRIYGKYHYDALFVNAHQPSPSGQRRNYEDDPNGAPFVELFVDRLSNTVLDLVECLPVPIAGAADDIPIGSSFTLNDGEKSEKSVFANGDFELRYGNWNFTGFGAALFDFPQPVTRLVLNANITQLIGGALNVDHKTEGSGNLFWLP